MRYQLTVGLALAGLMVWATGASAQASANELEISGTSSVRAWQCTEADFSADVEAPAGFADGVVAGQKTVEKVSLTFPVEKIDCGNGKMQEHLEKALKAKDYPTIAYTMSTYEIGAVEASDAVPVKVTGEMTIAGETRPVVMDVTVTKAQDGGIRVQGDQEIRMTEFGVKPPTLMFGTLKVGDAVHVKFDVVLRAGSLALGQEQGGSR